MIVGVASPASVDQPEIGLDFMEPEEVEALEDALAGLELLPRENAPARFRQESRIEKPAVNAAEYCDS